VNPGKEKQEKEVGREVCWGCGNENLGSQVACFFTRCLLVLPHVNEKISRLWWGNCWVSILKLGEVVYVNFPDTMGAVFCHSPGGDLTEIPLPEEGQRVRALAMKTELQQKKKKKKKKGESRAGRGRNGSVFLPATKKYFFGRRLSEALHRSAIPEKKKSFLSTVGKNRE